MSAGTKVVWPVLLGAGTVVAAAASRSAVAGTWRFVTGEEPPTEPEHPDTPWAYAFAWGLASAVAFEGARLFATRQVARYWLDRTGDLPPLPRSPLARKRRRGKH